MYPLTPKRSPLARRIQNESGSSIVYSMLLTFVLVILGGIAAQTMVFGYRDAYGKLHQTQALYLAEAGMMSAWNEFNGGADDLTAILLGTDGIMDTTDDGVLSFGPSVNLGNGNYTVRITDNDDGDGDVYADVDNTILVTSTGNIPAHGVSRALKAYTQVFAPPTAVNIQSAISSAGPIATSGSLKVDGRDHDINGGLIPVNGVAGIMTAAPNFTQSGGSKVGGTAAGVDYNPRKPADPEVIQLNAPFVWTTPDMVVQMPEGTLKKIAKARHNGSQYVTDPSLLHFPLSGVTYVELPSGVPWDTGIDFGNSEGILVVHNGTTDAIVKNLNVGYFRGLIIADDIVHIHATLLGAVINLTPTPSEGNCIGNGSGDIFYSEEALQYVTLTGVGSSAVKVSWFY